jgi:hypothetical protein
MNNQIFNSDSQNLYRMQMNYSKISHKNKFELIFELNNRINYSNRFKRSVTKEKYDPNEEYVTFDPNNPSPIEWKLKLTISTTKSDIDSSQTTTGSIQSTSRMSSDSTNRLILIIY